jgi:cystathionine beta-synthase
LVPLQNLGRDTPHRIWGKCEFLNPAGSLKDRIAYHIIGRASESGLLRVGTTTLVEATGGNTGVALAAAAGGDFRVIVTMTDKMPAEKVRLLKAWGAEVVICPYHVAPDSPQHFTKRAEAIVGELTDAYYVDQFRNPWNREAHWLTTGPEIWEALGPALGGLVAGAGTGGTVSGAGAFLRERQPDVEVVLADPVGSILGQVFRGEPPDPRPYLVEGIGGDFVPDLLDFSTVTRVEEIPDVYTVATCLALQRDEGLFVGGSAGCAVAAALRYARSLDGPPQDIVAVLGDSGDRAASTIYSAQWRRRHGVEPDLEPTIEGSGVCISSGTAT